MAPADLEAARRALERTGWRATSTDSRAERFLHEEGYNWKALGPQKVLLELHYRLWGSVPTELGPAVLERSDPAPELGASARRLNWADAYLVGAAHFWVTPPPRPLVYWRDQYLLLSQGGDSVGHEVARAAAELGLQLPVGLVARGVARIFGDDANAGVAEQLLADLRPAERLVARRAERGAGADLPLGALVLARLLSGRPSRMGWKAVWRRIWAHPGVVEQHTNPGRPWLLPPLGLPANQARRSFSGNAVGRRAHRASVRPW